jgi:Protein of unknown function (DUF2796)
MFSIFYPASLFSVCLLLTAFPAKSVNAHSAHVHGKADIKLAVDGNKILLVFETPQDSLVGIERAPQSAAELAKANAAIEILKVGSQLFTINPEASCSFKGTNIQAPSLTALAGAASKSSEHADVVVSYNLECVNPSKLSSIAVNVFDVFKQVKVVQVQFVGTKKQKSVRLTSSARTVKF